VHLVFKKSEQELDPVRLWNRTGLALEPDRPNPVWFLRSQSWEPAIPEPGSDLVLPWRPQGKNNLYVYPLGTPQKTGTRPQWLLGVTLYGSSPWRLTEWVNNLHGSYLDGYNGKRTYTAIPRGGPWKTETRPQWLLGVSLYGSSPWRPPEWVNNLHGSYPDGYKEKITYMGPTVMAIPWGAPWKTGTCPQWLLGVSLYGSSSWRPSE